MKLIRKIINKIAYRIVPNLRLLDECEESFRASTPTAAPTVFTLCQSAV